MQCENAIELLSVYHDGELSAEERAALEVHLETCPRCAAELAELRRLSELTSKLDDPQPKRELRDRVLEQHEQRRVERPTSQRRTYTAMTILGALAATAIIVIGIRPWKDDGHVEHDDITRYWQSFQADPLPVQKDFLVRHSGRMISADEAVREVGFRPVTATQIPDSIHLETSYLLNMPCCKCIESICRRPDGTALAVFEHRDEQPGWFPGRAHVNVRCANTKCRVTELDSCLAASWPIGDRVVTVVGLRDVEELTRWVGALVEVNSARQKSEAI